MITNKSITAISSEMAETFEEINLKYIKLMSRHIGKIGKLKPEDLHILEQMAIMGSNADEINKLIAKQCKISQAQLQKIYIDSGAKEYDRLKIFYDAKGVKQVPLIENYRMMRYIEQVAKQTGYAFENISRTTAVRKEYQKAVDRGIYAVTNGMEDYQTAVRTAVKTATERGTRIAYASGLTRRLDSAVRMNILDGARQINNGIRMMAGEEFGADGVEISAHALCAPDHLDIQGKQYALDPINARKYDVGLWDDSMKLPEESDSDRPIGELNCQHAIYPIVLGVSEPTYSEEELEQYRSYSKETFDFDGEKMTRYEASQKMRQLETKIRYQKEYGLAAKGYGDTALEIKAKENVKALKSKYSELAKTAELRERGGVYGRMTVSSSKSWQGKTMDNYSLDDLKRLI